jgi:hypothetical protein
MEWSPKPPVLAQGRRRRNTQRQLPRLPQVKSPATVSRVVDRHDLAPALVPQQE